MEVLESIWLLISAQRVGNGRMVTNGFIPGKLQGSIKCEFWILDNAIR